MGSIEDLRKKIDVLDRNIIELLTKRAKLVSQIGRLKLKKNIGIMSKEREFDIIERLKKNIKPPLKEEMVEYIYDAILAALRSIEKRVTVSYLGPEATFTHQAAIEEFGPSVEYVPRKSIEDVFDDVEKRRSDYGVVPIENSSEGIVNHTLDMFIESDLYICAERELKIEHYLLSNEKSIKNVKVLFSHPQAISQCSRWIKSNLPNVQIHETSSTADAASHAAIEHASAAIASLLAKKIYHLDVLAERIQDYPNNFTRFLIISTHHSKKTGSDKTSILVSIKDRVGALFELLKPFKENGINLTKIESRPSKKKPWDYYFFIDFNGHIEDENVKKCLKELKSTCEFVKFLGSYPSK